MNHQKFNLRSWVLLVLVGLAGAGVVGAQQGPSVVTVCPQLSEGCQFTDIQDAVNATKPSDIVQIAPGIYETKDSTGAFISVMIAKSLILRGTGTNPEEVVLKANREIPVVRIEKTQNVTMENLTVRDGNGGDGGTHPNSPFPLPGELLGGGLHIKDSVSVTLRNVTVTDNLRYGLVAVNVRNLTVERSQFSRTDQSLGRRGGSGIYLESSGAIFTEIYDPLTNTWQAGTALPKALGNIASVVINNRIYVIGGDGSQEQCWASVQNHKPQASVSIYDPLTNKWSSGPSLGVIRSEVAAAVVDKTIYAIGGRRERCTISFVNEALVVGP
ncbi:right-handed parallel beta-helix repeat-containing protein [Candidatus Acetothermia bacterium]|jgi:hypothetical protein|nr:right-handed parallel beta-helix repeat-containing protein [Candidatus Acetothermia bacterium]MCI2436606.1 right-handed parallel beta-helix repeat-containing protein [Candidatus Acetothermia bacterium]